MSKHEPDEPELLETPLDPSEDARIRALLADARHTEAMPADVVARLDRVLAGLATERAPVALCHHGAAAPERRVRRARHRD